MTETPATEAPVMLRATITRDELVALKIRALTAGMDVQDYLADLIRKDLAS